MVAVDTMSPISDVADDPCVQSNRGKAWNYLIDALTGQGPSTPSIDTNNNGVIERTDAGYSGYGSEADGETKYMKNNTRSSGEQRIWNPINDPNDPAFATNCAMNHNCAFINRSWRQLFPR
jgi:Tfp pilus tip-associated adhesin PilY1